MDNIDAIIVWPDSIDYPLFREFLKENRKRFKDVIVVWTETNWGLPSIIEKVEHDLKSFKITFLKNDPLKSGQDWRDIATNKALKASKSAWIWFVEQDFIPKKGFWKEVEDLMKRTDVFGRFQESRLHPCCLFIKRELLDKTSKDFAANPIAGYDHFGRLQIELENKQVIMGIIFNQYGHHMNSLTHNLYLLSRGEDPIYNPEEFFEYLERAKQYDENNS